MHATNNIFTFTSTHLLFTEMMLWQTFSVEAFNTNSTVITTHHNLTGNMNRS